jgi:DNA-binding transcriptional LysR family regulator
MKFTFDQLEAFIAVAEEEHFGRAAERLHLTQPPLSRQIQTLERHLGVELFDRSKRRTRLTAAGAAFLVEARRLVAIARDAEDVAGRVATGVSGAIRIGFTSVVGNATLPRLLPLASRLLPDVQIILHEVRTPQMPEALLSSRIDLALGREFELTRDLKSRPLAPDGLVIAVPDGFLGPGADGGERELTSLRQLGNRPFVMYSGDAPHHVHDVVTSVLIVNNVRPRYVQRAMEVYTMLSLVGVGVGAAIVPQSTANWSGRRTAFVEVPELRSVTTHAVAVWRQGSPNPALPHLLAVLAQAEDAAQADSDPVVALI